MGAVQDPGPPASGPTPAMAEASNARPPHRILAPCFCPFYCVTTRRNVAALLERRRLTRSAPRLRLPDRSVTAELVRARAPGQSVASSRPIDVQPRLSSPGPGPPLIKAFPHGPKVTFPAEAGDSPTRRGPAARDRLVPLPQLECCWGGSLTCVGGGGASEIAPKSFW